MRIVFMGTPDFAVPSLEKLIRDGYDIVAVITQPDRKSGRGHKMCAPPVKLLAQSCGIPVLQFEKVKTPEGVEAIKSLAPEMIITAAFGQILSKEILDIPSLGCLNVHASLLPAYRGAAPIQWAIINGEKRTGVTIMYMNEGLDTGDLISSAAIEIGEETTGGELYDTLAVLGAELLIDTLRALAAGTATQTPQDEKEASYYPPLSRQLAQIDWSKSAREIFNLVRALDPVMGGIAQVCGETIKIWRAKALPGQAKPGHAVCADDKQGLLVGTGDGLLQVLEIQAPCCKRMAACDYFRGRKLPGDVFETCGDHQ